MTRIVAGVAGGRRLKVPPAGTRPTSDRVREALFSAIDSRLDLDGTLVLDLYAGSGALGLEALSRGAQQALLVESDRKAADVVRANIAELGLPGAELRLGSVYTVLKQPAPRAYDVVFSDPPYDVSTEDVIADLTALAGNGWLAPEALVVVERSSRSPEIAWPAGYVALKTRKYGETRVELAEFDASV